MCKHKPGCSTSLLKAMAGRRLALLLMHPAMELDQPWQQAGSTWGKDTIK
jgi:hypothetical protein